MKIVKKVEEGRVSFPVGDKQTSAFSQANESTLAGGGGGTKCKPGAFRLAVAAAGGNVFPGGITGAAIESHYCRLVSKLKINLPAAEFEALADKLKVPCRVLNSGHRLKLGTHETR